MSPPGLPTKQNKQTNKQIIVPNLHFDLANCALQVLLGSLNHIKIFICTFCVANWLLKGADVVRLPVNRIVSTQFCGAMKDQCKLL